MIKIDLNIIIVIFWINYKMLYFSCILLLLIQVFAEDKPLNKDGGERFPKILWSYWHQGLESASTFTKMCLNNQRHFA